MPSSPASVEFPEFLVVLEVMKQCMLDDELIHAIRDVLKLSESPSGNRDSSRERSSSGIPMNLLCVC